MEQILLNNGVAMPQIGYGVYRLTPALCEQCVGEALRAGYRMIDTAQSYRNEEGVGAAVRRSRIPRSELFLVSKVWISDYGDERTMRAVDESLRRLQTDYIDLMLLHQPYCDRYGAWRALERAFRQGKVRAIGVSNFYPDHFLDLAENAEIVPAVNQVEMHVFDQQVEAQRLLEEYGTRIMGWAPLAEGRGGLLTHPTLAAIGAAHGKSPAQVALRWLLQRGAIIIPSSTNAGRMRQNLALFDFALSGEEMAAVAALDTGRSLFFDHHDPETVRLFMKRR